MLIVILSFTFFSQGFVAAVAPFNFTAIGGNLAGTPAMMVSAALSISQQNSTSDSDVLFG